MKTKGELANMEEGGDSVAGDYIDLTRRDKVLGILAERDLNFDPNSPEAKRVRWKIDLRIMPMIFAIYCLQLMDKNSLSYAAIMGIKEDANLTSSQYSWLGSLV